MFGAGVFARAVNSKTLINTCLLFVSKTPRHY